MRPDRRLGTMLGQAAPVRRLAVLFAVIFAFAVSSAVLPAGTVVGTSSAAAMDCGRSCIDECGDKCFAGQVYETLSGCRRAGERALLDLTPVGGQTRVSDMNADEGSPHDAGSDTKLPARIQTRSCPPCPLLTEQERRPDRQGAWRLGQLSA